jgi:membrane-bound inhibitor of C-type lysozyme
MRTRVAAAALSSAGELYSDDGPQVRCTTRAGARLDSCARGDGALTRQPSVYRCADGTRLGARFIGTERAVLKLCDGNRVLRNTLAASGSRYKGRASSSGSKGMGPRLIVNDLLTPPCSEWREYRAEPVDLDGTGCGVFTPTASPPMSTGSQLREKLRKIEALFAGAGTAGERLAAEAALERARERLAEPGRQDPSIEMQFSMPDQWSRRRQPFDEGNQRRAMRGSWRAPSRSCTSAGWTTTVSRKPSVSTRIWRLRPVTFLAASKPCASSAEPLF